MVACEERFPEGDANPVLVVVVEREAAVWRERLRGIHEKLVGNRLSGSDECMEIEVIDRSTEETVRSFCAAGLLQMRIRATRAAEELSEEARDAVREAILSAACAAAVRARLRELEKLEETIIPPMAACWGGNRLLIQRFVTEPDNDIEPVMSALQKSFG